MSQQQVICRVRGAVWRSGEKYYELEPIGLLEELSADERASTQVQDGLGSSQGDSMESDRGNVSTDSAEPKI